MAKARMKLGSGRIAPGVWVSNEKPWLANERSSNESGEGVLSGEWGYSAMAIRGPGPPFGRGFAQPPICYISRVQSSDLLYFLVEFVEGFAWAQESPNFVKK
ncbi:hypothetical protein E3N88_22480 [Mikania micrantha]|uniref:Uncharacterized protein n=1 Tax=Mikania micrantha TaxID=192012 RepID=A0A5N6NBN3_9ASTR|nr:hypothetical protein E3N88_22480 [Mikania micrantha]